MRVVAISGSPHLGKGNTALLLDPFLEGMRGAGASVELFYTKQLEIKPCQGEFNCWLKTPGQCFQRDDMQMLLPKLAAADIWVLATPVYVDGLAGPLKNLLDRIIPAATPLIEVRDGHCRHAARAGVKGARLVLVANCGFWELDNFDPLLVHLEAVSRNLGSAFAGALLRPHGPALRSMLELGGPVDDILDAAKEAGRQLVQDGRMSPETLKVISRELLPRDAYVQMANQSFQRALDELNQP